MHFTPGLEQLTFPPGIYETERVHIPVNDWFCLTLSFSMLGGGQQYHIRAEFNFSSYYNCWAIFVKCPGHVTILKGRWIGHSVHE